jgi:hypothetical protein
MMPKDKTPKFPKEVGGVKVPKKLRKSAGIVAELAQNPLAREVLSAVLVAGAAALTKGKAKAAAATADTKKPGIDVGALIAQGVAAFVSNLAQPQKSAEAPHATAKPTAAKPATAKRDIVGSTAAKPKPRTRAISRPAS